METLDAGMMPEFGDEVFRAVIESLTAGREEGTGVSVYLGDNNLDTGLIIRS